MKSLKIESLTALVSGLALLMSSQSFGAAGGSHSGGGDKYTLDFVRVATQILYPWLVTNGSKLSPPVDSGDFFNSINPKQLTSEDHVFESCDGSNTGREVDACYNSVTGFIDISRTRYDLSHDSPAKSGLVAHELFRKMGIEGDQYEISKQIDIVSAADPCSQPYVQFGQIFALCGSMTIAQCGPQAANSFRDLISQWKDGIGKHCINQGATEACMDACTPKAGLSCLSICSAVEN